ncbi:MAG: class I SAM-dependent methyltransferase [Bacilli bacterium]|nr:class I SAM-dependent methyltransferase [Bacilli bacterium]
MSHYFTNDKVKSEEKEIKIIINDQNLKMIVDNGIFSKKGLDFGTRSLLENINIDEIKGDVLDFGCGYGPIGIYIKKVCNVNVDMVDINERALNLAKKNAILNNVKVNIYQSNIYSNINKKYDFIITNPPIRVGKKILNDILFSSLKHLKENGSLIYVINKNQGAKTTMKDLDEIADTKIIKKNKGFYIILAKNR